MAFNQTQSLEHKIDYFLADEAATQQMAIQFAKICKQASVWPLGLMIYLHGDLGAGKSCFSRAFIQYFLPDQAVKSPTYTLVEHYATQMGPIHHFDLYRLCDAEELEFMGIRDLLTPPFLALVEWPNKGKGILSSADVIISLQIEDTGRRIAFKCLNNKAKELVKKLAECVGTQIDMGVSTL